MGKVCFLHAITACNQSNVSFLNSITVTACKQSKVHGKVCFINAITACKQSKVCFLNAMTACKQSKVHG